jgi:hypothetical protein
MRRWARTCSSWAAQVRHFFFGLPILFLGDGAFAGQDARPGVHVRGKIQLGLLLADHPVQAGQVLVAGPVCPLKVAPSKVQPVPGPLQAPAARLALFRPWTRLQQAEPGQGLARLDPHLVAALLNRGMLHSQEGRYAEAATDLRRALDCGADPALVHYNLALVSLARKDRSAARASLRSALLHNPFYKDAQDLLHRLRHRR